MFYKQNTERKENETYECGMFYIISIDIII